MRVYCEKNLWLLLQMGMRMLRLCGKTVRDGISNDTIREMTGAEKIE